MASYILYGKDTSGRNAVQRGELTNSNTRYSSFKTKEDKNASLEAILQNAEIEQPNLSIRPTRDIYVKKRLTVQRPRIDKKTGQIVDPGDSDIPGMVELWEAIDRISHLISVLEGETPPSEEENIFESSYRLYRLRHHRIEMCRDQYLLKEIYKPVIYWPNIDRPGPQYFDWTADSFYWISEEEWREKLENSYSSTISKNLADYETRLGEDNRLEVKWVVRRHTFDWCNPLHVRALINNWQSMYDAFYDRPGTYGNTLLLDFERYRAMADIPPVRDRLLDCKLRQLTYEGSLRIVQEEFGAHYTDSNMAVILNRDIPNLIAKAAQRHALLIDTPLRERKQCFRCKQLFPRSTLFFSRNNNRKDGFASNCKPCEKVLRIIKKEDQEKWKRIARQELERASAAAKPNPS